MKYTLLLFVAAHAAVTYGKPVGGYNYYDSHDLPLEAREMNEVEIPGSVMEYYGGARGKYLLISPDGRQTIAGQFRPPGSAPREDGEEEDVGVAEDPESVAVEQPGASASIAEAKPVAVSVAGVGGTASAQPVATAIVGPGGLAVSRPIATAVAGLRGSEALAALAIAGPPAPRNRPAIRYY